MFLAYPKFKLTSLDREELLADYLPYCETISMSNAQAHPQVVGLPQIPPCRDPFDEPFLHLELVGKAEYLITGDRDLLSLGDVFECPIITASDFLALFES